MLLVSQRQRNEISLQQIRCSEWSCSQPSSLNLWVAELEERDQLLLSGDQYRNSTTGNSVTRSKNHASSTRCTTLTLVAASPWWSLASCSRHGYKLAPNLSALSGPIHSFCESRPVLSEEIRFCQSDTEPTALSRDSRSSWFSAVVAMTVTLLCFCHVAKMSSRLWGPSPGFVEFEALALCGKAFEYEMTWATNAGEGLWLRGIPEEAEIYWFPPLLPCLTPCSNAMALLSRQSLWFPSIRRRARLR